MALTTSLAGRVRNTSLPKSHALLPLLEAVVNGLQAIDARFGSEIERGRLQITIRRSGQHALDFESAAPGRSALQPIVGFTIEDNGVGFTPENMASFETLDSDHKARQGGRGVGRLLWLKAFDRVSVRSAYEDDDGALRTRHFGFSVDREVEQIEVPENFGEPGAIISLDGFGPLYQRAAPKTVEAIAREIFEHCIWYFLRPGGAPEVTVVDDETISLGMLLDEFVFSTLPLTTIEVGGARFDMTSLCLRSSSRNITPRLYWCAASRVVSVENITGKIAGLYGRLKDAEGDEFTYGSVIK